MRSGPEVWVCERPVPGRTREAARVAEEAGFDGLAFADTQNLSGDPYSALCLAAQETRRLRLATGATNPLTRHPTVTASAILTVHAESGGRAVLGIGRGDSSLELAGLKPAKVDRLARTVRALRDLVAGRE